MATRVWIKRMLYESAPTGLSIGLGGLGFRGLGFRVYGRTHADKPVVPRFVFWCSCFREPC